MPARGWGRRAQAEHEARHLVVVEHYGLGLKRGVTIRRVWPRGFPNPMVELAFQLAGGVGNGAGTDFDELAIKAILNEEFPKKEHRRVRATALRDAEHIVARNLDKIERYADTLEKKGRL